MTTKDFLRMDRYGSTRVFTAPSGLPVWAVTDTKVSVTNQCMGKDFFMSWLYQQGPHAAHLIVDLPYKRIRNVGTWEWCETWIWQSSWLSAHEWLGSGDTGLLLATLLTLHMTLNRVLNISTVQLFIKLDMIYYTSLQCCHKSVRVSIWKHLINNWAQGKRENGIWSFSYILWKVCPFIQWASS